MLALVVTHAFADFGVGDHITDPAQIAKLKESSNAVNVVQVSLPDTPAATETAPA